MNERILILDFGSQYTQLIARRVRELNVYSEIVPYNKVPASFDGIKGIILSGSPFSVTDDNALHVNLNELVGKVPVLAVCYGAQYVSQYYGGKVQRSSKREYGKANLTSIHQSDPLLHHVPVDSQVWMSRALQSLNRATPKRWDSASPIGTGMPWWLPRPMNSPSSSS